MCAVVMVVGQTADLSALLGLSGAARGVLSFVFVLAAGGGLLARCEEAERDETVRDREGGPLGHEVDRPVDILLATG